MLSYPRRLQSGHFTCYLNRTYHVLTTVQGSPLASVRQNRLDVARLTLETLINTYPDSTYASMAKEALQDPVIGNCRDSCAIPAGCHKYAVPETMGPY